MLAKSVVAGEAPAKARELIARAAREIGDEALRADLIELIERVIIYKLPQLSREEIQTMLQIQDIRQSRVYKEAKEEGLKEGIAIANAIAKMAAKKMTAEEIATNLKVDVELVQLAIKESERN